MLRLPPFILSRPEAAERALCNEEQYKQMYQQSIVNPQGFWREHGQRIDWFNPFTQVKNVSFRRSPCRDQVV